MTEALADVLRRDAAAWGVKPDALTLRYVTNPGGFVNHSFRAADGVTGLHIKLATPEDQARLRQWLTLATHLSTGYHAPPVRGWIDVPAAGLAGLVFEHIEGRVVDDWNVVPVDDLGAVINNLHHDGDLAAQLGPAPLCRETFFATFDDRFREDLKEIHSDPPPFVSPDVLGYLEEQVDRLADVVRTSEAFHQPGNATIHSDIWLNNILVTEHNWFLLDWDDLMRGDPALDAAMIGGPLFDRGRWALNSAFHRHGVSFRERVDVYQRAYVLDWCIDVLADYMEAARWLDDPAPYQAAQQQTHEQALLAYRRVHGDNPT